MPRFSIMSDQTRFENAIRDTYPLFAEDNTNDTIVEKVKDKYQEKEIHQLIQWFSEIPKIPNTKRLSLLLKTTLWVILLFKILGIFSFILTEQLSVTLIVVAIFLGPLINIAALTLAYKETANSNNVILGLLLIGFMFSREEFDILFEADFLSFGWIFVFIGWVSFVLALFTSWRLQRVYNSGPFRTRNALERLGFQL